MQTLVKSRKWNYKTLKWQYSKHGISAFMHFFPLVSDLVQAGKWAVQCRMAESDAEPASCGAGRRLGAPVTLGISTLDPGHQPPAMPPGRQVAIRVRMLDDTEEIFDVSVSYSILQHCSVVKKSYTRLVRGCHGNWVLHARMHVWKSPRLSQTSQHGDVYCN